MPRICPAPPGSACLWHVHSQNSCTQFDAQADSLPVCPGFAAVTRPALKSLSPIKA
ncbi:hypothetical protein Ga0061067_11378 [Pannonibacter indicus]|uniref:Uncharacterized protein n=1 Tax=Pannonibacter indicus TaxID=466044 RepID=A0A0K6I8W7_9HYPH|nr:hypothetical protein Ga0061067_11378 [Pannonibacter indicus]